VGHNRRFPNADSDQNEAGIPDELAELGRLIGSSTTSNRPEVEVAFQKVVETVQRRRRILLLVQEALSQLRLDIKYLMFDLDVTRKERNELREQLEDR
jgi:hypothetical protein